MYTYFQNCRFKVDLSDARLRGLKSEFLLIVALEINDSDRAGFFT